MRAFTDARAAYLAWLQDELDESPWEVPPGSNRNPYSRMLGRGPEAWCVDYAIAGLKATGSGGGILDTASTRLHIGWGRDVGRYRSPRNPALAALTAVSRNGVSVHTDAAVLRADTSRLLTIGGNTSNRGGSTADGGGVYVNDRTYMLGSGSYRIYGYTLPFFGLSEAEVSRIQRALGAPITGYMTATTVRAVKAFQKAKGLTVDGFPGPLTFAAIVGAAVEDVIDSIPAPTPRPPSSSAEFDAVDVTQRRLNALGYGPLEVDGKYGPKTAAATRQYQTDFGITADGRPGPATRSHMEDTMAKIDDILTELKRVRPDVATVHNTVIAKGDRAIEIATENQRRISQAVSQTGPIHRGGKEISVRQEIADAKTMLLEVRGVLDGIAKTLDEALPSKDS